MLNFLMKGLIVVGAAGIVAGIAYVCNKKEYAEIPNNDIEEAEETENDEEPATVSEKILNGVLRMVDWLTENQGKIEAISAVVGLVTGCFELKEFINNRNNTFKKKGHYILFKDNDGNEYLANYIRRLS